MTSQLDFHLISNALYDLMFEVEIRPISSLISPSLSISSNLFFLSGKEIIVGLTSRTNEPGAMAVARAFPEYPCCTVVVNEKESLKRCFSMAGSDVIAVGPSKGAQTTLRVIAVDIFNFTLTFCTSSNLLFNLHLIFLLTLVFFLGIPKQSYLQISGTKSSGR